MIDGIPLPAGITWPQVGMTLVLLLPSLFASWMSYRKSSQNTTILQKQDENLEVIHQSVNGGLGAAKREIAELKAEIAGLKSKGR